MERSAALGEITPAGGVLVRPWRRRDDHARIPHVYARVFGRDPWGSDWDHFAEFDPKGVFVAESADGTAVGFSICFRRARYGYVSVVAVVPEYRRRGVASALVATGIWHHRDCNEPGSTPTPTHLLPSPPTALWDSRCTRRSSTPRPTCATMQRNDRVSAQPTTSERRCGGSASVRCRKSTSACMAEGGTGGPALGCERFGKA